MMTSWRDDDIHAVDDNSEKNDYKRKTTPSRISDNSGENDNHVNANDKETTDFLVFVFVLFCFSLLLTRKQQLKINDYK